MNILETEGAKKGAHYTFDREPQVVLHVKPGCHDDVDQAYKSILYGKKNYSLSLMFGDLFVFYHKQQSFHEMKESLI